MRVLLAGDRPQDRDQGRRAALGVGFDCAGTDCVPLADLRLRLARDPVVHLVVVYTDPDPAAAIKTIESLAGHMNLPIYAVTTADPASVQESLLQAGATDVWPLGGVREQMLKTSESISRETKVPARRGRVVAVAAALPGSGATTVATGLAFALAGSSPVLLAELGMGVPELSLDLDLKPMHSLADLLHARDRMDARLIRDATARHPSGVEVLAYPPEATATEAISPAMARDLHILLRNVYDWSVLDLGHPAAAASDELLRYADTIVLVARLDPPSLRLTRRYVQTLTDAKVPAANISVVVNRFGQAGQIPWRKAQEAFQSPIQAWFPDDPRSVNRALAEGQPLVRVARGAKLTRELSKFALGLRNQVAASTR